MDDLAIGPADFDRFTLTAPLDPRLPGGGGYEIEGYDIKPAKFGVAAQPFVTLSRKYGKQEDYWNGVDATVNARPRPGMFFQGGVSTGKRVEDNCDVIVKVDNPSPTFCHRDEPWITFVKGYGSYTIPRIDVQFSGTYQSKPGPLILALYTATNAQVAPSLGRNLAGAAPSVDVHLVSPGPYTTTNGGSGHLHAERLHQVDFRISKLLQFGGTRSRAEHGYLQRTQLERGADTERHVCGLAAAHRDHCGPLLQVQRAVRFLKHEGHEGDEGHEGVLETNHDDTTDTNASFVPSCPSWLNCRHISAAAAASRTCFRNSGSRF